MADYLLLEDGDYLLQEDGSKIIIQENIAFTVDGIVIIRNETTFTVDGQIVIRTTYQKTFTVDGIVVSGERPGRGEGGKSKEGIYDSDERPRHLYQKIDPIYDSTDHPKLKPVMEEVANIRFEQSAVKKKDSINPPKIEQPKHYEKAPSIHDKKDIPILSDDLADINI